MNYNTDNNKTTDDIAAEDAKVAANDVIAAANDAIAAANDAKVAANAANAANAAAKDANAAAKTTYNVAIKAMAAIDTITMIATIEDANAKVAANIAITAAKDAANAANAADAAAEDAIAAAKAANAAAKAANAAVSAAEKDAVIAEAQKAAVKAKDNTEKADAAEDAIAAAKAAKAANAAVSAAEKDAVIAEAQKAAVKAKDNTEKANAAAAKAKDAAAKANAAAAKAKDAAAKANDAASAVEKEKDAVIAEAQKAAEKAATVAKHLKRLIIILGSAVVLVLAVGTLALVPFDIMGGRENGHTETLDNANVINNEKGTVQHDVNVITEKASEIQQEVDAIQQEVDAIQQEVDAIQKEAGVIQKQVDKTLDTVKNGITDSNKRVGELTKEVDDLKHNADDVYSQYKELASNVKEGIKTAVEKASKTVKKASISLSTTRDKVDNEKKRADEFTDVAMRLRTKADDLERDINKIISNSESEIENVEKWILSITEQMMKLNSRISNLEETTRKDITEIVSKTDETIKKAKMDIDDIKQKLINRKNSVKEEIRAATTKINNVLTGLDISYNRLGELIDDLNRINKSPEDSPVVNSQNISKDNSDDKINKDSASVLSNNELPQAAESTQVSVKSNTNNNRDFIIFRTLTQDEFRLYWVDPSTVSKIAASQSSLTVSPDQPIIFQWDEKNKELLIFYEPDVTPKKVKYDSKPKNVVVYSYSLDNKTKVSYQLDFNKRYTADGSSVYSGTDFTDKDQTDIDNTQKSKSSSSYNRNDSSNSFYNDINSDSPISLQCAASTLLWYRRTLNRYLFHGLLNDVDENKTEPDSNNKEIKVDPDTFQQESQKYFKYTHDNSYHLDSDSSIISRVYELQITTKNINNTIYQISNSTSNYSPWIILSGYPDFIKMDPTIYWQDTKQQHQLTQSWKEGIRGKLDGVCYAMAYRVLPYLQERYIQYDCVYFEEIPGKLFYYSRSDGNYVAYYQFNVSQYIKARNERYKDIASQINIMNTPNIGPISNSDDNDTSKNGFYLNINIHKRIQLPQNGTNLALPDLNDFRKGDFYIRSEYSDFEKVPRKCEPPSLKKLKILETTLIRNMYSYNIIEQYTPVHKVFVDSTYVLGTVRKKL